MMQTYLFHDLSHDLSNSTIRSIFAGNRSTAVSVVACSFSENLNANEQFERHPLSLFGISDICLIRIEGLTLLNVTFESSNNYNKMIDIDFLNFLPEIIIKSALKL